MPGSFGHLLVSQSPDKVFGLCLLAAVARLPGPAAPTFRASGGGFLLCLEKLAYNAAHVVAAFLLAVPDDRDAARFLDAAVVAAFLAEPLPRLCYPVHSPPSSSRSRVCSGSETTQYRPIIMRS